MPATSSAPGPNGVPIQTSRDTQARPRAYFPAGAAKGSQTPGRGATGTVTMQQVREMPLGRRILGEMQQTSEQGLSSESVQRIGSAARRALEQLE